MKCGNCGYEIKSQNAKHCKQCGKALIIYIDTVQQKDNKLSIMHCGNCGHEIKSQNAKHCKQCGKALINNNCSVPQFNNSISNNAGIDNQSGGFMAIKPNNEFPIIDKIWYAHYDNQQRGPFTQLVIQNLLENKKINLDTFLWREGFQEWVQLKNIPELSYLISENNTIPAQVHIENKAQSSELTTNQRKWVKKRVIYIIAGLSILVICLIFLPDPNDEVGKKFDAFIENHGFEEKEVESKEIQLRLNSKESGVQIDELKEYEQDEFGLHVSFSDGQIWSAGLSEVDTLKSPRLTKEFYNLFVMSDEDQNKVNNFIVRTSNCTDNKKVRTNKHWVEEMDRYYGTEEYESATKLSEYTIKAYCIINFPDGDKSPVFAVIAEKLK